MEMNVVKTKAMRILRQTFPIKNTIDKKTTEHVDYSKYFGSMTVNFAQLYPGLQ